jgi:hypothetical protein
MLLPIVLNAPVPLSPALSQAQAMATIRIERPGIANAKEWEQAPKSSRREIIIRDKDGRPVRVRLIEYE